ncbi:hypothetical protein Rt10032_c10g4115 [Rhodotorula toruloides]|uniref:Uncharacterized protein n=1 Tax=Rhodotorula toruloides TaxID=5286 RepID=A0A511KIA8_RHOTO|nr:hypothetical protein Rt10032_c10g4115 [Rhodotorula toruloides]
MAPSCSLPYYARHNAITVFYVADLSYFIGLPGGYDTLEEIAEMTTWSHIGVHLKQMANTTATPVLVTPEDSAVLTSTSTIQRVLIAQSVFEEGTNDFGAVAKVLHGHALLRDCQPDWFEPGNLSKIWVALVHNVGQDASVQHLPQAPALRKIAHKYYMDRVEELHEGMQLCQNQFRMVYSEIQELREGRLDWKLTHPDRNLPPSPVRPAQNLAPSPSMVDVKMEDVGVGA